MTGDPSKPCSRCGVALGRAGKCPALCEPVEAPPPKYTGELIVGGTHIGNLVRANSGLPGWIG